MSSTSGIPPQGQYELSPLENTTVDKAAQWARILAIIMLIDGGLAMISCNVIGAALKIAVGVLFLNAAKSLKAVVDTQGNDITNLMTALDKIGQSFAVRIWVMAIGVGLLLLIGAIAAVVVLGVAAGSATP